jgi:serine/threonine protein kinase
MEITGILVLAADTLLTPVDQLSDELRRQLQATVGDYAVTRPSSRTLARIIDSDAARLLEEFRQPTTVVDAVIRYCNTYEEKPESTLDAAFPLLERLVDARLLVSTDSLEARSISPLLEIGSGFAGCEVLASIQVLEDTDLYRVKSKYGSLAALKLMRSAAVPEIARMFDREASILKHLDATVTPALLGAGKEQELGYLLLSWCDGDDCASVAARIRSTGDYAALQRLSIAILDAYAHLHAQGVIHSDIHPNNILVAADNRVNIVDFGLARCFGVENESSPGPRGGVGFFFEPEYANALRVAHHPPAPSLCGEQYALAALIYLLITGRHYVDFSLEKHEMLRQVAEDIPLTFMARGIPPWPYFEEVLAKALAKDPAQRFPSVAAFAKALNYVGPPLAPAISHDADPFPCSAGQQTLTRFLRRFDAGASLFRSGFIDAPRASITCGSAGIACALHRIACARQDPKILSLADLWCERASRDARLDDAWYCPEIEITDEIVGRISPYHTESGVHFIKAQIAHSMGDVVTQKHAIDNFIASSSRSACDNLDLTLGRSGVLLAASHLLGAVNSRSSAYSVINTDALRALGNTTLFSIWQQLDSYRPIPECRQLTYSGIAHGWAGIMYATLCWCQASSAEWPAHLEERLSQLESVAHYSGGRAWWSWKTVSEAHDHPGTYMTGWCNGTAGQVYLWLKAHSVLKDNRYFVLAEKAALHVAEADSSNGSLCCGLSGQAYALLALYQRNREKGLLRRAHEFAERAATVYRIRSIGFDSNSVDLRPDSLFKGEPGVAVLAADLEYPDTATFPAFEFIEF